MATPNLFLYKFAYYLFDSSFDSVGYGATKQVGGNGRQEQPMLSAESTEGTW